jgi:drug/metabolite transporter (DMT)-like permease
MELWIILALISALCLATSDALTKRVITKENAYVIAWFRVVFALPLLFTALVLSGPLPTIDRTFVAAFCAALPLDILAILLYYKALRISPLTLTLPFLSVTPVFLILMSFVLVGQAVTVMGGIGVALITLGGYTLNLSALRLGFLEPFRAILRERGSRYMLIIAFVYSMTSALGKIGVSHSSAPFFGAFYFLALAVFMLPIITKKSDGGLIVLLKSNFRLAVVPALFDAVATVSHFYAVSMANIAYMVAIKRTSLLFGMLYGFLLFRERNVRERLLGALLMFSGFVLIVVFS